MAVTIDPVEAAILDQLPEGQELSLEALIAQLHQAGQHDVPGQLLRYKHRGLIVYRLEKQPDGNYSVMVSRKGAE